MRRICCFHQKNGILKIEVRFLNIFLRVQNVEYRQSVRRKVLSAGPAVGFPFLLGSKEA